MSHERTISGKAKVAGVMGWPVEHTKSPRLHGYWLRRYNIDGIYIPMAVEAGHLEQALRALPLLGFKGCNVTIPHKEQALKYVDVLDPVAQRAGAVNTIIVREKGELEGKNTDVFGFSENLKTAGFEYNKAFPSAVVLGAGGVARAMIVALQDMGYQDIRIVNRNKNKAEDMTKAIGGKTKLKIFSMGETEKALEGAGLLANATSLGMEGHDPLEINLSFLPREAWVTDAVYAPLETALIRQARQKHLRAVDGLGMLLHQARAGFKSWFGQEPEVTKELRAFVLEE